MIPEVPSLVELGYPDFEMQQWHALFAPVGTPEPILDRLNAAAREALAEPAVLQNFERTGTRPFPVEEQTPEGAMRVLKGEISRWRDLIKRYNISLMAAP